MRAMGETTYRLISQKNGRVSVEMTKSGRRPRIIPDFRDEAAANAWIAQTQRLINETFPYLFGVPRHEPDAPPMWSRRQKNRSLYGAGKFGEETSKGPLGQNVDPVYHRDQSAKENNC